MRLYRVVMRSGINVDVTAEQILDDPKYDVIYFYADEDRDMLACTVKREEMAGLIILGDARMTKPLPNVFRP